MIRILALLAAALLVLIYRGLHVDIPYILAGSGGQILRPSVLLAGEWFLIFSVFIYLATAVLALFRWRVWVLHLLRVCLAVSLVSTAFATAMFFVDTLDMYPHVEEERLTLDVLITALLAHSTTRLRRADRERSAQGTST